MFESNFCIQEEAKGLVTQFHNYMNNSREEFEEHDTGMVRYSVRVWPNSNNSFSVLHILHFFIIFLILL